MVVISAPDRFQAEFWSRSHLQDWGPQAQSWGGMPDGAFPPPSVRFQIATTESEHGLGFQEPKAASKGMTSTLRTSLEYLYEVSGLRFEVMAWIHNHLPKLGYVCLWL